MTTALIILGVLVALAVPLAAIFLYLIIGVNESTRHLFEEPWL